MTTQPREGALRGAGLQVLDGFGMSVKSASPYVMPQSVQQLADVLGRAEQQRVPVCFRGSGRSYGDAAIGNGGLVIDTRALHRVHAWEPTEGVIDVEGGLTIEGLWRRTIEDGWWPPVVPGTMHPTLAGCLAMNVHGKNNYRVGPIGDHIVGFDLLTMEGTTMHCSREQNADVFHAAIGGLGLLGAITRLQLQLKRVHSGRVRVHVMCGHNLEQTFDVFERHLEHHDYLVGWIDCTAKGSKLGRGVLHGANYLQPGEDPEGDASFHVENQGLPSTILGVPRGVLWRFMKPFMNDYFVKWINTFKYLAELRAQSKPYYQSHVAFAFLLDYVPNWRLAYGRGGFIQYQVFVPHKQARACLQSILTLCHQHKTPPYLGVFKRHRPDAFLLSHALDGWSLAMDFPVRRTGSKRLERLVKDMTQCVLEAGGKFYFAKDSVLTAQDIAQAYGTDVLGRFAAIKHRLDPNNLLESALSRRLLPTLSPPAETPA